MSSFEFSSERREKDLFLFGGVSDLPVPGVCPKTGADSEQNST